MRTLAALMLAVTFCQFNSPLLAQESYLLSDNVPDSNTRDSEMFGGPSLKGMFRLPEIPTPQWSSLPGFATARKLTVSSYQKTRRTTRRWWQATTDWINPFDSRTSTAPVQQGYRPQDQVKERSSNSWWWFGARQSEPEVETVNDFLQLERPTF